MDRQQSKKISFQHEQSKRCEDCNFWKPKQKSKIRYTWGVCLASGLLHKWTCSCIVFTDQKESITKNGVIYLKESRFVVQILIEDLIIIL